MAPLKILYIGPDYRGSNATCWRDALAELGHSVSTLNTDSFIPAPSSWFNRAQRKYFGRPAWSALRRFNHAILSRVHALKPRLVFHAQARFVLPDTLREIGRTCPNFAYFNDDMFNPCNQDPWFLKSLPWIHCSLTTKSYNVPEFLAAGAPWAVFLPNAYDPRIHHPVTPSAEELRRFRGDLAFIGTFRPERADFLAALASPRLGWTLNVWGGGWDKMGRPIYWLRRKRWNSLSQRVRGTELWGEEMAAAFASNKICLGLLYRANRDLHTSRTFEIPACGGFMLAERTAEHRLYFEEDREAAYYSSIEELRDKVYYYLNHDGERLRIAQAGHRRCLRSAYRYADRAAVAMEHFKKITGEKR